MSEDFFGDDIETISGKIEGKNVKVNWDWKKFQTTKGFPVDENLINWVIGQEQALNEGFLCLSEWVHKLKHLSQKKWYERWRKSEDPTSEAERAISPGPYLLLLGDPGTGKSLLGKALADKLTKVYKENGIKLFDVLCWKNASLPSQPEVSIHKAGEGEKILKKERLKELKKKFTTNKCSF